MRKLFLLLLSALIFTSCSDKATNPDLSKSDKIIQRVDQIGDSLTTRVPAVQGINMNIPGVEIALWSDELNLNYVKTFGASNIVTKEPINPNSLFRIASITKTFVITVFLQLVDEIKVSLDDKLSKFYPNYPRSGEVTLRQLCNMTSGIFNFWETDSFGLWISTNPQKPVTIWQAVSWAKDCPTPYYNFTPGNGFHYSNTNTYLLGLIIETLTGNKLEDEVNNRIIKKLGLSNTFFPSAISFPVGLPFINGYYPSSIDKGPKDVTEFLDLGLAWSAGAMISNIYDLKTWVKACVDGTLISTTLQTERMKTVPFEEAKMNYGLGIMEYKGFYGHGGNIFGYQTFIAYSPVRKTTIAVMLNNSGDQLQPVRDIIDCYLAL